MAYFGIDTVVRIEELNLQFKNQIRQRGGNGLQSLRTIFNKYDANGNGKLDIVEFEEALGAFGLFPKMVDLKALHKFYDVDGDGNICYNEFVNALSDNKMCKRKTDIVEKAWVALDKEQKGEVTYDQLKACLKDQTSPIFGGMEKITVDEFLQYYREVATQVPNDEYFVAHLEKTWIGVVEDLDAPVKKDKVRHIIKLMRHRLTTIANSSQEEYVLREIFRTFDLDKSGALTINEMAGLLAKLGIACEEKELLAVMREMDTNKTGVIEFEEFCNFMVVDPWK